MHLVAVGGWIVRLRRFGVARRVGVYGWTGCGREDVAAVDGGGVCRDAGCRLLLLLVMVVVVMWWLGGSATRLLALRT